MTYWIQFIEQAGDNKNFSRLTVERLGEGKLHIEIDDTYTDTETKPCIILRAEQVEQLKGFLNNED